MYELRFVNRTLALKVAQIKVRYKFVVEQCDNRKYSYLHTRTLFNLVAVQRQICCSIFRPHSQGLLPPRF